MFSPDREPGKYPLRDLVIALYLQVKSMQAPYPASYSLVSCLYQEGNPD